MCGYLALEAAVIAFAPYSGPVSLRLALKLSETRVSSLLLIPTRCVSHDGKIIIDPAIALKEAVEGRSSSSFRSSGWFTARLCCPKMTVVTALLISWGVAIIGRRVWPYQRDGEDPFSRGGYDVQNAI